MRLVTPDETQQGIYSEGENALERIILWKAHTGQWWLVARTNGEEAGYQAVEVAYQLDKSERTDTTVTKWAERTIERARHPEEELEDQ